MNMDWNKLCRLPREELKVIQDKGVKYLMKTLVPMHPFYRRLYESHPIDYQKIITTDDLTKLPFSSKLDILPTKENAKRPKEFILQPNEDLIKKVYPKFDLLKMGVKKLIGIDIKKELEYEFRPVHTHFTTGRSTNQIPFLYTRFDLELLKAAGQRLFDMVGSTTEDIAINAFPYAPHLAFWQAFHATTSSGALSLQTGGGKVMGTAKIIQAVERMKATMFIVIPGYGYHLFREAAALKKDFSSLKFVMFGGERVNPGLCVKIKEFLAQVGAQDARLLATYGLTEGKTAWVQCHENSGYHLYPDLEFIELVDKEGDRVKDGEKGEIVYTNLGWRGSIVIRYRTGDICDGIEYNPCPYCGRTVPRLKTTIERCSEYKEFQLTKIKGELVNLNMFYQILPSFNEVQEWQVEIRKANDDPFDLDEIHLNLALKEGVDEKKIVAEIETKISNDIYVRPVIHTYPLSQLLEMLGIETELKEKRIVDNRP